MPKVYWLIRAQRRLKASLSEQLICTLDIKEFHERKEKLSELLAETFPDAEAVIVRDRLRGYRQRTDIHVLLVEVVPRTDVGPAGVIGIPAEPTTHIVKIGEPKELALELAGWKSCRPIGLINDSIFISLYPGPPSDTPGNGPKTLVYQDAYQTIGAGDVITLEDAVISCCRWNTPSVDSIDRVLRQVYERLGSLFYVQCCVPDPIQNLNDFLSPKLKRWLEAWDEAGKEKDARAELLRCRRETYGFLSRKRDSFLDTCDYLKSVLNCPQFTPRMVRGCAHGDLQGRNILIGLVQDEAASPAVYDYEDMRPDNLIGWDFVKLETEIKVRALQVVFRGLESEFINNVHRFEVNLAERTEDANNNDEHWFRSSRADSSLERLTSLILGIRRLAKLHLGTKKDREREWLEEYYFLLACYGVCAGRYETYQRRHIISAYISAGTVTRRLSRPWSYLGSEIATMESKAEEMISQGEQAIVNFCLIPDQCEMSHHARFAFAQKWSRSECEPFMRAAIEILIKLKEEFPHVLEIEEEMALTYLNLKDDRHAEEILEGVNQRYRNLHDETYCRWGRLWKDRAQKALPPVGQPVSAEVTRYLRLGLNQYQKAYDIRHNYYPGINVATLHFILGDGQTAKDIAMNVLSSLDQEGIADDPVWVLATRAEAEVLRDNHKDAERLYRSAVSQNNCMPQNKKAMSRQIELILRFADDNARNYWTSDRLHDVFGNDT